MPRSLIKNVIVTVICLSILMPGLILMHGSSLLQHKVHSEGFNETLNVFWDALPCAYGITSYNSGHTPYPTDNLSHMLAYPPIFLWVGGPLARWLTPAFGWRLYTVVNVASVVLVQIILSAMFFRRLRIMQAIFLCCFMPIAFIATTIFWSGNIHLMWYGIAMLAAITGVRNHLWLPFYFATLLATLNQPVFAILLLLPVLAGQSQMLFAAATALLAGTAYFTEKLIDPSMYAEFQASVKYYLQASHDYGQGLFGICAKLLGPHLSFAVPLSMAVQAVFSASIFFLLLYLKPKERRDSLRWLGLIAIAIVLINPRVMMYDAAIGIIPACYFLVCRLELRASRQQAARWLMLVLTILLSLAAHKILGFSLLLLSGFASGVADEISGLQVSHEVGEVDSLKEGQSREAAFGAA